MWERVNQPTLSYVCLHDNVNNLVTPLPLAWLQLQGFVRQEYWQVCIRISTARKPIYGPTGMIHERFISIHLFQMIIALISVDHKWTTYNECIFFQQYDIM